MLPGRSYKGEGAWMGLQAKSQEGNLSRCLRARLHIRVILMGRPGARTYTPVSQVTDRTKAGGTVPRQLPDPRVSSSGASVGSKTHWSQEEIPRRVHRRGSKGMWAERAPAPIRFQPAGWLETCVTEHIRMSKPDPQHSESTLSSVGKTPTQTLSNPLPALP